MNSSEIARVLKDPSFLGVFPSNQLPKITQFPASFVANTDPSTKSGAHWVAFYLDSPQAVDFFDSYGQPPAVPAFKAFLKKYKWKHNVKQVQGPLSSVCGHYSIYFILKRREGVSMNELVQAFGGNYEENDEMIKDFVNDNFDLDTVQYDVGFVARQICKALNNC